MPRESQLKKSKTQTSRSPQPSRSPPPPRSQLSSPIQKQTEIPKIGLLDTFVQGLGWGLGTSVSGKIVDKIFSSDENLDKNSSHLPNSSNLPKNDNLLNNVTEDLYKKYQDCLENNNNNNNNNCYSIIENSKIEKNKTY